MELYLTIGIIIIGMSFSLITVFINIFIEQLKYEDKNVGYIEGMIVERSSRC